jgi:hypothetical protein
LVEEMSKHANLAQQIVFWHHIFVEYAEAGKWPSKDEHLLLIG